MSILFSPLKIKSMALKNRFVRSATFDNCGKAEGRVSEEQLSIIRDLAIGGIGLIIKCITCVHKTGQVSKYQNLTTSDEHVPELKRLVETAHRYDAKIAVQLFHGGREAYYYMAKKGHALTPFQCHNDAYYHGKATTLSEKEILEIIDSFGNGARRAREAGFDAIQIHGAHAYLFSQFLSPYLNQRNDAWGGELSNRLRFHEEVYRNIRQKVGDDYPVLIKLGVEDCFEGGLTFDEGKTAALRLAELGYDSIEVSSGLRGKGYKETEFKLGVNRFEKEAYFREWTQEIKKNVSIPIMLVGGLRSFSLMQEVIEKGDADAVSLSRPLIREPDIVNRWRKDPSIMPECISCNKCYDRLLKLKPLQCGIRLKTKQHA